MNESKSNGALIGVGVAACAVCCATPILGVLAAIGVSAGVGYALFGVGALLIGATAVGFVVVRRRRRTNQQVSSSSGEMSTSSTIGSKATAT